jgi:type II secretory pathway pseudopilin PulG
MKRVKNWRGRAGGGGFTLVEAVLSTVVVAVMLVAALNTVGASRLTQHKAALVSQGRMFAEALLAEILQQSYQEPGTTGTFGREAGELDTSRAAYDDVDDYHGWTELTLVAKDGTTLSNATNWKRTVTVEWVNPLDPTQVSGTETGAKRITVVAAFRNVPQATVVAIKTAS